MISAIETFIGGLQQDEFAMLLAGFMTGAIVGRPGSDRLRGADQRNRWQITGDDSGLLNNAPFSGIEYLEGDDLADEFVITDGGSIAGGVDEQAGDNTVLGAGADTTWNVAGVSSGEVAGIPAEPDTLHVPSKQETPVGPSSTDASVSGDISNPTTTQLVETLNAANSPPVATENHENLSEQGDHSHASHVGCDTDDHDHDYLLFDGDAVNSTDNTNPLTSEQLDTLFQEALRLWSGTNLSPEQLDRLNDITVEIVELDGGILGEARGYNLYIDTTAAGRGWFVDATPGESSEFGIILDGDRLVADSSSEAFGRVDLLTVLLHEIGHVIGLGHDSGLSVMEDRLGAGERLSLDNIPGYESVEQLIFVDANVLGYQSLINELSLGAGGGEIVILNAARDGVEQITEFLQANSGIAAVHILSHGASGSVSLGDSHLSTGTLERYADQLATWREALASDADILLYGCNIADGEWGVDFIENLAVLTGADVAASDDATGAAARGGDWVRSRYQHRGDRGGRTGGRCAYQGAAGCAGAPISTAIPGGTAGQGPPGRHRCNDETLQGKKLDDTYVFTGNFGADKVVELPNEGNDTIDLGGVSAGITITLAADGKLQADHQRQQYDPGPASANIANVEVVKGGTGANTLDLNAYTAGALAVTVKLAGDSNEVTVKNAAGTHAHHRSRRDKHHGRAGQRPLCLRQRRGSQGLAGWRHRCQHAQLRGVYLAGHREARY